MDIKQEANGSYTVQMWGYASNGAADKKNYSTQEDLIFAAMRAEYDSDINPPSNVYNYNCYAGVTNSGKLMNHTGVGGEETLASWQAALGKDANSYSTPIAVNASSTAVFLFNPTATNQTQSLTAGTWYDSLTNTYSGTVAITPYSSKTLWK